MMKACALITPREEPWAMALSAMRPQKPPHPHQPPAAPSYSGWFIASCRCEDCTDVSAVPFCHASLAA
jgi:hypothetical protein